MRQYGDSDAIPHDSVDTDQDEAQDLLRRIGEEIPLLTSSSGESDSLQSWFDGEESTDSGNSEIRWGFNNVVNMMKEGGARYVAGNIVPVSIGNSSISDNDEETKRILAHLRQYGDSDAITHESVDTDQDDGIQISSSDTGGESLGSVDELIWFRDDVVTQQVRVNASGIIQAPEVEEDDLTSGTDGYQSDDEWSDA